MTETANRTFALTAQFVRFLFAGGTSVIFNFLSRHLLGYIVPFEVAVCLAYLVGMITAYGLMYLFVFPVSGRGHGSGFFRFAIVNVFSLLMVLLISVGLLRLAFPIIGFDWHPEDVAHFIGLCGTAITGYIGHKLFTFHPIEQDN